VTDTGIKTAKTRSSKSLEPYCRNNEAIKRECVSYIASLLFKDKRGSEKNDLIVD
jgi:hypothetical protein